jgi:hypothetical protein
MEIEDLKTIWKKQSQDFQRKNKAELATMLRGKSTSIISQLERNVWMELIFTFTGAVALLGYALTLPAGALKSTSITIPILFCIYSLYYVKKLQLLRGFDAGNENLRANLGKLIESLKGYLKFYKRSYSILYPVYLFLALLFSAIERGADDFLKLLTKASVVIPLVFGAAVFFLCSTWLTSWYLKKLYGKHLEKLEGVLREIGS